MIVVLGMVTVATIVGGVAVVFFGTVNSIAYLQLIVNRVTGEILILYAVI